MVPSAPRRSESKDGTTHGSTHSQVETKHRRATAACSAKSSRNTPGLAHSMHRLMRQPEEATPLMWSADMDSVQQAGCVSSGSCQKDSLHLNPGMPNHHH